MGRNEGAVIRQTVLQLIREREGKQCKGIERRKSEEGKSRDLIF